jgi:glycosyltransferase involved in cell wall biosynthesis
MRISVAMCTYNGAAYVREQLDSILAQRRQPDEVIICDDCSSDTTRSAIEFFAAAAPFDVRVQVNETNLGIVKNFERAIAMCDGEIIALCDQDDVWLEEKLQRIESVFASSPGVGLVFTDADLVNGLGERIGQHLWESTFGVAAQRMAAAGHAFELLALGNFVTGATAAFRAQYKDVVLSIPADITIIHDAWIALLIAAVSKIAFIPEPLIRYRVHPDQYIGIEQEKPPRQRLRETDQTWREHQQYFESEVQKLEMVTQRLAELSRRYPDTKTLPLIELRIEQLNKMSTHFRARGELPRAKLKRIPVVIRELIARRYHRYARGVLSAGLDILR